MLKIHSVRTLAVVATLAVGLTMVGTQLVAAQLTVTASLGQETQLPAGYFGFNFDYGGVAVYPNDPQMDSQVAQLDPGTLRFPGGTGANYYIWQQGKLSTNPNGPTFTLQDLKNAYQATGAVPIFDLNVMTSTPSDQMAMLTQAQQMGLPVHDVELGNEFYLATPDYVNNFPTAADYGATVATYVKLVHSTFPGARVSAVGALRTDTAREQTWNAQMLAAATQAGGAPDSITLHDYPNPLTVDLTSANLPTLLQGSYQGAQAISTAMAALPGSQDAWITEYNLRPTHPTLTNPPQTTYAHALFVASLAELLPAIQRTSLVDYWAALGSPTEGVWSGPGPIPALTPGGQAMEMVDSAAQGADQTASVVFTGEPLLPDGNPALIGRAYMSSSGLREILVNLTASPVTIPSGSALPPGASYQQVTGNPVQQMYLASNLSYSSGTVGGDLELSAYSITLLRSAATHSPTPSPTPTPTASPSPSPSARPTPPSPPTNVVAVADGSGRATVTWSAPASDGGSPILAYVVLHLPPAAVPVRRDHDHHGDRLGSDSEPLLHVHGHCGEPIRLERMVGLGALAVGNLTLREASSGSSCCPLPDPRQAGGRANLAAPGW